MTLRTRYLRARSLLRRKAWLWNAFLLLVGMVGVVGSLVQSEIVAAAINGFVVGYSFRALTFDRFYRQSLVNFARLKRSSRRWRRCSKLWQSNYESLAEVSRRLVASRDERRLH